MWAPMGVDAKVGARRRGRHPFSGTPAKPLSIAKKLPYRRTGERFATGAMA
jgi:hypothetical protein